MIPAIACSPPASALARLGEALAHERHDAPRLHPSHLGSQRLQRRGDENDDQDAQRRQQGAAHAADGYARATGKVGVCLGTSGPAATNLVTGDTNAVGDVFLHDRQTGTTTRVSVSSAGVQGNAESLVAIARKETDIEMRKDLVQKLSLMKSKVATDYLMEILGK